VKYLISLVVGLVFGAGILLAGLYLNPFATRTTISPLTVSDDFLIALNFPVVPSETVLTTNNGESVRKPHPEKVQQLWEKTIQKSWVSVVELSGARGEPVGVGIKFASQSEKTRPLNADALVDSAWHIYLPDKGTLFVNQTENYWSFLRDVVAPARWDSANSWRGNWRADTTVGPGALRTARVVGLSGDFADVTAEAVESMSATAYSAIDGPVGMSGSLLVAVPHAPVTD
jgi:hypothetical protein